MTKKLKNYFPIIRTKDEILNEINKNPNLEISNLYIL